MPAPVHGARRLSATAHCARRLQLERRLSQKPAAACAARWVATCTVCWASYFEIAPFKRLALLTGLSGGRRHNATLLCVPCVQTRQKVRLPPASDDYNAFIAWVVNKVCLVFAICSYTLVACLIWATRNSGQPFRAKDALLSISELSSCSVPGVLPGLADPCPAAPLGVSEL